MLGGKAIARVLRGHNLVESALTIKLQHMLFNEEEEEKEYDTLTTREIEEIEMAVFSKQHVDEVVGMEVVKKLDTYLEHLQMYDPTS